MRQKAEPDQVLNLRQTIQIMQEKLDEREGNGFRPVTPSRRLFKGRLHVGSTFDFVLSVLKLSCPGETAKTARRTIHFPRKQWSS